MFCTRRFAFLMSALIMSGLSLIAAHAQTPFTLTIGVFGSMNDPVLRTRLDQFESAHPDIKTVVVTVPSASAGLSDDPAKHFDQIAHLAASADILQIVPDLITEADSRTGDFLNLKPYADQDATLNPTDYYPAVWQSWQWDNALWGLPATVDPIVFQYAPAAFDNSGLSYPTGSWTATDFDRAIRTLSVKNAQGEVTESASSLSDPLVLASLSRTPLLDSTASPNPPKFESPALTDALTTFGSLQKDGYFKPSDGVSSFPLQLVAYHNIQFATKQNSSKALAATLLPGNRAGLETWGFAVSGGTSYPEQAYELARFLADMPNKFPGIPSFSARQALAEKDITALAADQQTLVRQALAAAIPVSDLRYTEYIPTMLVTVANGTSAADAAQAAQTQAEADLKTAVQSRSIAQVPITVATIAPKPSPVAGKITLKFGIPSGLSQQNGQTILPNQATWDALGAAFAQSDPEVGQVVVETDTDMLKNGVDCFYRPVPSLGANPTGYLLPIEPLTEIDPDFNSADFVGTVLGQSTYQNKLWVYPITIEPTVIVYDPKAFAKMGVPLPVDGWTIDQFIDALKQLHAQTNTPAFSMPFNDFPLLLLIAAYNGVPIDYRTNPNTWAFTAPANVDAIRQVLDLAKAGLIAYHKTNYGPRLLGLDKKPIQTDVLSTQSFRLMNTSTSRYQVTTFPTGTRLSGLAYNIGSVALDAKTPYASACYRWIKVLAKHPELFNAMPASRSEIADPNFAKTQGSDMIAFYQRIARQLDAPNTIPFPSGSNGHSFPQSVTETWLFEAFDQYVLNGADLQVSLAQAQDWAVGFNACVDKLPLYQPGDIQYSYLNRIKACAVKFDPSAASLFPSDMGS